MANVDGLWYIDIKNSSGIIVAQHTVNAGQTFTHTTGLYNIMFQGYATNTTNGLMVPTHISELDNEKWKWDEATQSHIPTNDPYSYVPDPTYYTAYSNLPAATAFAKQESLQALAKLESLQEWGEEYNNTVPTKLGELFPGMHNGVSYECPEKNCAFTYCIPQMIIHLNDNHRVSREYIANWLDSLDVDLTLTTAQIGD